MVKSGATVDNGPLVEGAQALADVRSALAAGDTERLEALRAEYQHRLGITPTTDMEIAEGTTSPTAHPNDTLQLDADQKSGVHEPQRLMALYLQGKLTQGELAFHLRAYNSVVADTIMRQSRYDVTTAIDYVEVPQPSVAKPGGVYHEPRQPTAKEKDEGGGFSPEVEESTNKNKKEEEQQKQQEDARQEAIQLQFTEENNREVFNARVWRELHHKELMRQEGFENEANSLIDGALESADRTKTGVTDAIRNKSPHHKRHTAREMFLEQSREKEGAKRHDRQKDPVPPPPVSVS